MEGWAPELHHAAHRQHASAAPGPHRTARPRCALCPVPWLGAGLQLCVVVLNIASATVVALQNFLRLDEKAGLHESISKSYYAYMAELDILGDQFAWDKRRKKYTLNGRKITIKCVVCTHACVQACVAGMGKLCGPLGAARCGAAHACWLKPAYCLDRALSKRHCRPVRPVWSADRAVHAWPVCIGIHVQVARGAAGAVP